MRRKQSKEAESQGAVIAGPKTGACAWRGGHVRILTGVAVAGVLAGAVLTRLLLRARANRRWDRQVELFREQGAM